MCVILRCKRTSGLQSFNFKTTWICLTTENCLLFTIDRFICMFFSYTRYLSLSVLLTCGRSWMDTRAKQTEVVKTGRDRSIAKCPTTVVKMTIMRG